MIYDVRDQGECFKAIEPFHGKYYVHDVILQICIIYSSNERTCDVQRGVKGLDIADCQL